MVVASVLEQTVLEQSGRKKRSNQKVTLPLPAWSVIRYSGGYSMIPEQIILLLSEVPAAGKVHLLGIWLERMALLTTTWSVIHAAGPAQN